MTKKIEKLTAAQELDLVAIYERALEYGRSTEPADRKTAEAAITEMYAMLKKPRPIFVWLDSPFAVCIAGAFIETISTGDSQLWSHLRSQLDSQLWSHLRSQLRSHLGSQLGSQLWSQLDSQLRSQLDSQLRSHLGSQLWSQLDSQLRSQLDSQLRSHLGSQLDSQLWSHLRSQLDSQLWSHLRSQLWSHLGSQLGLIFWGQHELNWITFYDFAGRIGVKYSRLNSKALSVWLRIGCSACWWQPRNGVVLMSDRPGEIHLDAEGRMHNLGGAAMKFRDGYSVWSIGGVIVDEQIVVNPETQTLLQIKDETNAEKKRIRIERFGGRESDQVDGWKRYLAEIGAKVVTTRRNDIDSTEEALVKSPDGMTLALVACRSTARRYALEVPPEIETCEQAQNWMRSGSWLDGVEGLKRRTIDAA